MRSPKRTDVGDRSPKDSKPDPPRLRSEDDGNSGSSLWTPGTYTTFKCLLSARFCAAMLGHVTDCDETYNYLEPLHYLLYGYGFQTWEYATEFALRSYAYLLPYALLLVFHVNVLQANKILTFFFLRCLIGLVSSVSEVVLYRGVASRYGGNVAWVFFIFQLFSTGMLMSSTSVLPSSFAMHTISVAYGLWLQNFYALSIFSIALGSLLAWPFIAVLGVPILIDLVFIKKRLTYFIKWSVISGLSILVPMTIIDSCFFGKLVVAPLNLIMYNVFTSHGANIYGTEPFSYYFINGFLNCNLAFVLALLSVPIILATSVVLHRFHGYDGVIERQPSWLLPLSGVYIWLVIFLSQSHKEERFLYPIYPLLALNAAVGLTYCQKALHVVFFKWRKSHYTLSTSFLPSLVLVLYVLTSISRSTSLYVNYHGVMDVYPQLTNISDDRLIHSLPKDAPVNVCVGKEWHRFPSHFFLPKTTWRLRFVQSEFRGQLPQFYDPLGTTAYRANFNDMNMEEVDRYSSLNKCHYLIDLDAEDHTVLEPRYSLAKEDWQVVGSTKYLSNRASSGDGYKFTFCKAFYIPYYSSKLLSFSDYNILKTTRTAVPKQRNNG